MTNNDLAVFKTVWEKVMNEMYEECSITEEGAREMYEYHQIVSKLAPVTTPTEIVRRLELSFEVESCKDLCDNDLAVMAKANSI